jgi:E3 ubiquitin-protein ligase synoviolin
MSRLAVYTLLSVLSFTGTLTYAWQTRVQFYPIVIFLVTSKASILVLSNLFLCLTFLFGKLLKSIFLGQLLDREVGLLWDKSRFAVTNTLLALTIFREELGVREAVLFVMLIFSKIFHWLCKERVKIMEGREDVQWTDHFRIVALKGTLLATDLAVVGVAIYMTQTKGPTVWIFFGFRYLSMAVLITSTFIRYLLFLRLLMTDGEWNGRETYTFYLDLITDVITLAVDLASFLIIFVSVNDEGKKKTLNFIFRNLFHSNQFYSNQFKNDKKTKNTNHSFLFFATFFSFCSVIFHFLLNNIDILRCTITYCT